MTVIITDPPTAPGQSAEAERERCSAILGIAAFARRREIAVDVSAAIRSGARAADVRAAVLDLEAERDEGLGIRADMPAVGAGASLANRERILAAFRRGHRGEC